MGIVDLGEPEKCAFALPLHGTNFLDPMTCNSKVTVSITSLPHITGDVYGPANGIALNLR